METLKKKTNENINIPTHLLIYKDRFKTYATRHGIATEPHAKNELITVLKEKSHKIISARGCGTVVSQEYPFLSASPDLIKECQCCGVTFVAIKCPYSITRRNFSLVACYLLKFTRCSLLVVKSIATRCKIRSLLVAKFACYLLQKLLVAKNHSLLVAKFARYSLQKLLVAKKITDYSFKNSLVTRCRSCSLQNSLVTRCKIYSLLSAKKPLVTRCKIRLLLVAKNHICGQK